MKKVLFILASVVIMQQANAQESFHKHALVLSADWGIDGYNIAEKYSYNGFPGTYTTSFGAGNTNDNISLEYGLGRWLGIGIQAKFDNYIIKKDTVNNYQAKAVGVETGVLVNFHLIRTHHFDFFGGVNIGFSGFTYTIDKNNDQLYGSGGWSDLHVSARYYFGRFGINASVYFPHMNYPNITSNNSNYSLGQTILAAWDATGAGFNLGIQYRFFNPPGDK